VHWYQAYSSPFGPEFNIRKMVTNTLREKWKTSSTSLDLPGSLSDTGNLFFTLGWGERSNKFSSLLLETDHINLSYLIKESTGWPNNIRLTVS